MMITRTSVNNRTRLEIYRTRKTVKVEEDGPISYMYLFPMYPIKIL